MSEHHFGSKSRVDDFLNFMKVLQSNIYGGAYPRLTFNEKRATDMKT